MNRCRIQSGFLRRSTALIVSLLLVVGWLFSGWPQVWNNPPFPPQIETTYAATLCERPSSTSDHYSGGQDTYNNEAQARDTSTCPGPDTTTAASFSDPAKNADDAVHWNWNASGNTYSSLSVKIRVVTSGLSDDQWGIRYTTDGSEPNTTNGTVLDIETTEAGSCPSTTANNANNGTCVFSATIPTDQDFTNLKVGFILSKQGKGDASSIDIHDVWTEGEEQVVSAPTVTTNAASAIDRNAGTLNGEITDTGGEDATEHGFAFGTNSTLSGGDTATSTLGGFTGTGTFNENKTSLSANTTYYFRAYATNSNGTGYGSIQNFTTDANAVPTVTSVSLNGDSAINLNEGTTISIDVVGTASDSDGSGDLSSATGTIYRSGVTNGASCSADDNNCYQIGSCSLSSCSGNSCTVTCTANIQYFAEPTDSGAFSGENWLGRITATDSLSATGSGVSTGVELNSLNALSVSGSINYGNLQPNTNTGGTNQSTTITNTGNTAIDVNVSSQTDLNDGGGNTIAASNQKYGLSDVSYGSLAKNLSGSGVRLETDLPKPTSLSAVEDVIYWGLAVPDGKPSGMYDGTNLLEAIAD